MKPKRTFQISLSIADLPFNIDPEKVFRIANEEKIDGIEVVAGIKFLPLLFKLRSFSYLRLPILSIHQPVSLVKKIIGNNELFTLAGRLKAKVVIHPLKDRSLDHELQLKYFSAMSVYGKRYHVKILLENLAIKSSLPIFNMFRVNLSTTKLENFAAISLKYKFGITFDTSHFGKESPGNNKEFLAIFNLIENIHLSDFDADKKHLALGSGIFETEKFIQFLKNKKYSGLVTLELSPRLFYSENKYLREIRNSLKLLKSLSA